MILENIVKKIIVIYLDDGKSYYIITISEICCTKKLKDIKQ